MASEQRLVGGHHAEDQPLMLGVLPRVKVHLSSELQKLAGKSLLAIVQEEVDGPENPVDMVRLTRQPHHVSHAAPTSNTSDASTGV